MGRTEEPDREITAPHVEPVAYGFGVGDDVFCFWDYDHIARNREFLQGIDTSYYATVSRSMSRSLRAEDAMAASIALRAAYFQAIETLMSLLGAMAQAPHCVAGWIAKCSTANLEAVVSRLRSKAELLTQEGKQRFGFRDLARQSLRCTWTEDDDKDETAARFADLWNMLAGEFLDDALRCEYNAMKHGMRIRPGGAAIMIGIEDTYGVPAPPDAMTLMGASPYGSTFYRAEQVDASSKVHFSTRRTTINWSAPTMACRLELIAMSIANIVSALLIGSGADPTTQRFVRPAEPDAFDLAAEHVGGIHQMSLDRTVTVNPANLVDKQKVRTHIEGRRTREPGRTANPDV